jgi:hypothetical protein
MVACRLAAREGDSFHLDVHTLKTELVHHKNYATKRAHSQWILARAIVAHAAVPQERKDMAIDLLSHSSWDAIRRFADAITQPDPL